MSSVTSSVHPSSNHLASTSTVSDYIELLKPGVMSLVVFTGLAGMAVAPGHISLFQQFMAVFCIALGSGAGAAMNMWYDRDIDAVMLRTVNRPIPAGRITPDDALAYGLFLAFGSVMLMGLALNWVAGLLLASAIAFYVVVYTMWLKRSTPQNIVIGGAAGAFPPMIGWAAVTGGISLESVILFSIIFLWTPPHFWALALYKNGDYTRAGVPMMPVVKGAAHTKRLMLAYTWALVACSLSLWALAITGPLYNIPAAVLGGAFLWHVSQTQKHEGDHWPRKTFLFSILYLFMIFSFLMLDSALPRIIARIAA
ncbi:MAG: heme o synthase [Rickettsiales bacterium]|nr:heme o synthase [Rickettsiales bacterium]